MRAISTTLLAFLGLLAALPGAAEQPAMQSGKGLTRVPVEVVSHDGGKPRWVMVEVAAGESVPEPGSLVLLLMSGMLLMRRRRN